MTHEKGNVSVNTENIFPIIRKWLYSDRDIFLRELVSNAADAISKMKKLTDLGEAKIGEGEEYKINVTLDPKKKILKVEDNGIGMSFDEIKKYINQIAFSGAMDFVEKYKDKTSDTAGIIGHFGLGFYSAFMVSDKVRIDTLSYDGTSPAASWESEDGMAYEMGESDKESRGTSITLELSDEGGKFLTADKSREILRKYCAFMPYPIYFTDLEEEKNRVKEEEKRRKEKEKEKKEKLESKEAEDSEDTSDVSDFEEKPYTPRPINDTHPLWLKNPKDCTDEEYKEFYTKAFNDYREPLFWIHLNMDYPFDLKGILYFPQMDNTYETLDGRIKLFYNQVFVADNIKEVIPDFLFLLKGCLDCPDLPLNVSRSFLQNDGYVQKLSSHIIKKVADKLTGLFKKSRDDFDKYWTDIGVFVKYGCMREEKFYDKVKDILLARNVTGGMSALQDLGEKIYYTNDEKKQVAYIEMAKAKGNTVVVLDHELDPNFMSFLEYKNNKVKFVRVDSEIDGEEGMQERKESLENLFRKASGDEKLEVQVKSLGESALAAVLTETEESRRMQEMQKLYMRQLGGKSDMDIASLFPVKQILVVNTDSSLVSKLSALADIPGKEDKTENFAKHIYDLARLSHGSLDASGMNDFLKRSTDLISELVES